MKKCPRCKRFNIDKRRYGTSRRDDKTKICSDCSTQEAMFDFRISDMKKRESKWMGPLQLKRR